MKHTVNDNMLEQFRNSLIEEEKSNATIEKYMRDMRSFLTYTEEKGGIDKETVMNYKKFLLEEYAVTSANSMLAAINRFFKFMGWYDCVVKAYRVQKESFRSADKELSRAEYYRLLNAAQKRGKQRLFLVMETICATGLRISELKFITVKSVYDGHARVVLKGKVRTILLPSQLCKKLKCYIKEKKMREGSVFVSRNGNPLDRSNILHDMKKLCGEAGVERKKVFPHNLRHLFACTYYRAEKNLSHLADILGHSNVNTTRIYTRMSSEEQIKQIETLRLVI